MHLQLCQVSKMLNETFDTQLLLYSFIMMMYTTVTIYYVYAAFQNGEVIGRENEIVVYTFNGLLSYMKIVAVSNSCECTMKEVNRLLLDRIFSI